jgi:hypothetical protein
MPVVAFSVWIGIAVLLVATNRDVCSPAKIVHAYALVFFLGFYFSNDSEVVALSYLIILFCVGVMGIFEALYLRDLGMPFGVPPSGPMLSERQATMMIAAIWLLTSLPLLAQVYLISYFGGPAEYLLTLALRVKEFAGLGPVISVIKILPVLSVFYFATVVTVERTGFSRKSLFLLHLALTVLIGLLSGSRSLVLMNFFWMILIWNNLRRPLTPKGILVLGVALVSAGFVLGTARDVVSYSGISRGDFGDVNVEELMRSTGERFSSSGTANTGLEGLRLVLDAGVAEPQLGLTFLTGITNFVPRAIWPEKPRSGGIVLTQDYAGDAWGGYSNLSTGAVTESMINFGIMPGFIIGILFLFALFIGVSHMYRSVVAAPRSRPPLQVLASNIRYIFVLQFVAGMLVGEFANSIVNLVLQLIILFGVTLFIRFLESHHIPTRRRGLSY